MKKTANNFILYIYLFIIIISIINKIKCCGGKNCIKCEHKQEKKLVAKIDLPFSKSSHSH